MRAFGKESFESMSRYASYEDIVTGLADNDQRVRQTLKNQAGIIRLQLQFQFSKTAQTDHSLSDCAGLEIPMEVLRTLAYNLVLLTSIFAFHMI